MVSKGWVAVTAPQAAIPPAMKDLIRATSFSTYMQELCSESSPCSSRHYTRLRRGGSESKLTQLRLLSATQGFSGSVPFVKVEARYSR